MKDLRPGEHLWFWWEGEGYFADTRSELIYFTLGHVDVDNDVVLRALASTLQRDGIVDSLGEGFRMAEAGVTQQGHVGILPGESVYYVCDEDGETEYGDQVENSLDATWIEL